MKTKLFLAAALLLVAAAAWPQLRITSLNSSGELTWTNLQRAGAYRVTWATAPTGPWMSFGTLTNLNSIWATTNRVTVEVPVSNSPAFYRVVWLPPDPIGTWDYLGYDIYGTVVVTGQLTVVSTRILGANLGSAVHAIQGGWSLDYAGPPTNYYGHIGPPQHGTGTLGGTMNVGSAQLRLVWPVEGNDANVTLLGNLWSNNYTGSWYYSTWVGPYFGPFSAVRARTSATSGQLPYQHIVRPRPPARFPLWLFEDEDEGRARVAPARD